MKKNNLIEMLQGCSMRNGMPVSASNPDGEPTVNRQSRLMSYQCSLRNLAMIFAILTLSIGQMWGMDYTPGICHTVNSNEILYGKDYTAATAEGSIASSWVVLPDYTSQSATYTNVTSDANGNPHSLTDNLSTISSSQSLPKLANTNDHGYTDKKRLMHIRVKGISAVIVHGVTTSTGRGVSISVNDHSSLPSTPSETASVSRSGSGGSFIVQQTGLTATTDYVITLWAKSGDVALYAVELIAASSEHWYVYGNFSDGSTWGDTEVEMDGNVDISLPLDAHDYSFKIKHVMSDGETTYYSGNNGIMSRGECTNWDMNVDENCRIRTDISGTYNFALTLNESTPRVTVTYPTGGVLVTLVLNNGGNNYSWYTRSGEPIIRPNFEPSKDGYAFDGWYADSECTEPWNWSTTVSSATTLYAKWSNAWYYAEEDDSWVNHVMTRTAGASYWYREASKKAATRQFKIQRNGTWYDCRQSSPGYMCTDVTNMNKSNNNFNLYDNRAGIYNNDNDYKILVFPPNTPANSTNDPIICASTSLPEEYYSLPSGRTIYFDNSKAEWANIYFRKGRDKCAHNEATALTKVPGTENLYQYTVSSTYNGYQAFHLANNCSWTGDNSIYKVNGAGYAITKATVFQKYTINEDVTFTPGDTYGSPSDGCQYYDVDKTSGMKTQNVSITAPSNGTITVNYVDVSGAAQAFSSGNRDLAHTCIITVTAEPAAGYAEPATISINGASHGNRDPYTITGTTVVAATFSPASYTVTLNTNGGTINADKVTSYTYGTGATLPTNVTKDGFTFAGWYDNSGLTGSPVTTISTTATGNKEYWAKWTEVASLTALECNTLYKVEHMVPASITLSGTGQYGAGLSANTKFEVLGDPSKTDQAGGTPEMKNEAASFAEQSFNARMYLKGASNTTGSGTTFVPTSRAVKFIVGESGTLDIYAHRVDRLYLKKVGDSGTTQLGTSTSGSGSMVTHNVTAGTYYIYATNSNTCIYGVRLNCCTTPAAPTEFTAGSITSTGATFTITDEANAASYDIYYSTSNSAPDAGTAATTTSTKKTKAVTGLTASTTYYAWVRSVCDADHKSAWVALTSPTAKFTTSAPEAEALVHWTMNVATDGAWETTATSTTDGTNISSISTSHDEGDNKGKNSATPKTAMAEAEVTTAAEPTKSAKFTFTVKAGKKVVPEKVTCEVFNVSTGNRTYKAQISDNNGHVYNSTNTVAVSTKATLTPATFTFASGLVLTGNVTVKIYAWGSGSDFRMGQHVKLFGEVDNYNCTALNLTRGGQESGTYTVGNYTGNPLTCTVNAGEPASYQWKQYTLGQGVDKAVNAEGSGSTTTSFTPNPASANTYFYACEVTDICGNTSRTPYTGTFVFNAAPAFTASTSVNIEQFVLDNSKSKFAELQAALDAAHISYDLNAGCGLDSLDDACNKTDRNNDYLGLKIKAGAKYIQMNVPAGKTLKVRFGKRVAAVKVWIDEVAQTDIPTNGTYYTYELASSASNRVVKIATADGNAVVIKQIMIGEDIKTVTLPAKITLGSTTNGTISVASTKVNVGSTVTVTATPSSGYELATLTYTPACPATSEPVDIKTTKQFNMPNGNVTINATFTAAAPAGDCDELFAGRATSTSVFTTTVGSATTALSTGDSFSSGGYSYSVKPNSSNAIVASPKAGGSFAAGDSLIVVVYNNQSGAKTMGFQLGSGKYSASVASQKLHVFRQKLVASDIKEGTVIFNRLSADDRWVEIIIKHCGLLPACTPPALPTLSNKTVCEGGDADVAWNATVDNASAITAAGETVAYSWKKKGNDTELVNTATFDLGSSATEAMAGTYIVTVTVSADGKASKSATKEVTLTVNEATEVTEITADKATVYPTNSVTLTATANVTPNSWKWYTCTNAEGADEAIINDATSASYTIASAPVAGTYYYKVKATGSCGIAACVYTLVVSPAVGGDCFHYVSVLPDKDISPSSGASIVTPTYATTLEGGTMKVGSSQVTITKNGLKLENSKYVSITLDAALEAGNVVIVKGSTATAGNGVTINGVNFYESGSKTFEVSYTVTADDGLVGKTALTVTKYSGSSYLQEIKITGCGAACNDPEVTASVDNSTACVGTSVTFTATGAHASATYQWQKYSGGAWTDIADADASTYTIPSVATTDALKYRVIASHECNRTSNEVTLNVPVAPVFNSFTATRTVMATLALSITDVEASDATSYAWYKSADDTYDAGTDTRVGTAKELLLASGGEAAGTTYYLFCVASNACGSTTSGAITVNVTAYVEEDCATRGNEGVADFGFTNTGSVGTKTYNDKEAWRINSGDKYLTYSAPSGKYLASVTFNIAHDNDDNGAYGYSTDNGANWTYVRFTGLTTSWADKRINLSAISSNITDFRIGRKLGSYGNNSGSVWIYSVCFEYSNACTTTTVTPSETSKIYEMGGDWTNPTFTLGPAAVESETLTYSSSNEEIASVDESGNVTFNDKAGTVTITASYAGGTISETEYCASSGSYTITVSCPDGAPKIVAANGTNMSGCNSSVTLNAKTQNDTDFADGTYQWFRNGKEISGATSSSYTATQTGVYTVEYTSAGRCTSLSTNSATVTSATVEPEVTKLVPFQYYHVDKNYSAQMKDRHLFSVKGSAANGSTGRNFKLTMSRNGGEAVDMTTAASIFVTKSGDGQVDTVMIDLNKLSGKYNAGDELVLTCAAVDCNGNASDVYKNTITIHVIGATPTLALICSGTDIAAGTRKTSELTVGGDFLTGYNKADLCQQTDNQTFDANTEWGLYTDLKANYIVTPVNGYAVFNKLNYEPFDILLLTDYPKASKSPAAATVLDDMADLCDYRPMLSFKTHMVAKSPSKWAAKGFTTSPVVTKEAGRLNLNIVCYAHPMFESLTTGKDVYKDNSDLSQLVYTMLSEPGYESSKGMQGFEIAAAENFVTIGLTHYNATIEKNAPKTGEVTWTPGAGDRMLVTVAERQTNIEARFILFSLNCGAQSKLTEKGEDVVLACLEYLLDDDPLHVADCALTFDNGAGNTTFDAGTYTGSGVKGDGKWSTEANWGPQYLNIPGEFNSARIAAPVTVDMEHAKAMELRIIDEGKIVIPAGKALEVKSTIRRMDGTEIYPTEISDIHIGSASTGNGTLIFDNNSGDTKARVDMYSTAKADMENMTAEASTWQYIGTPHTDVTNARSNYYGSWLYQYSGSGWDVIPNGGPLVPFRGYCITHPISPNVYEMTGTLAATTTQDIAIPAGFTVIANSWVAPIDINAITEDDMEGISDKTIYFFNTGTDAKGENGTGTAAGTYRATPIHSASYTGDWQIPSMQGFYVSTTSAGTFHLDYDRHVRPTGGRTIVSKPMYAPRRAKAAEEEPAVLKIFARGSRYQDKLVVLEREDFTRGYDSGWDGEAWGGSDLSPMVYVTGEGREDAVSAIPEFEGTVVAFKAGEDSEYRFEFIYSEDAEPLYLFDTENNTYTQIMTGNAYYFTTSDKAPHSRFILTRKAPQITTGTELTSDGESAKARKLLIEDKMYILLNGMLYDATGKVVK